MLVLIESGAPWLVRAWNIATLVVRSPNGRLKALLSWETDSFRVSKEDSKPWSHVGGSFLTKGEENELTTGVVVQLSHFGSSGYGAGAAVEFTWPSGPAVVFYYAPAFPSIVGEVSVVECSPATLSDLGQSSEEDLDQIAVASFTTDSYRLAFSWCPPRKIRKRMPSMVLALFYKGEAHPLMVPCHHMKRFDREETTQDLAKIVGIVSDGIAFSVHLEDLSKREFSILWSDDAFAVVEGPITENS